MDIESKVTFYALKMGDGSFKVFKKIEIPKTIRIEDFGMFDDYQSADEAASKLQKEYDKRNDAYLSDTQDTP